MRMAEDPEGTVWRTSSYTKEGNCVEIADLANRVIGVRDSKNPSAGHLMVGREALRSLVGRIRAGQLDL
jgi:Domain of unknown function (DUF397)